MYFNVGTGIVRSTYNTFGYERDYVPEQAMTPTEDDEYITADCGHEVYGGECIYESPNGRTLCPRCMNEAAGETPKMIKANLISNLPADEKAELFDDMSLGDRAELLGFDRERVMFDEGW